MSYDARDTMAKKKLNTLTHEQKRQVCNHKEANPSFTNRDLQTWIVDTFKVKVHETTISRILKEKHIFLSKRSIGSTKRNRECASPSVEEAMYHWFLSAQEAKLPVSDDFLTKKIKVLHAEIEKKTPGKLKDCCYNHGWLQGFKHHHTIRCRKMHGEAESAVMIEMTWQQFNNLRKELEYELTDIYNMDETRLFYRMQPNKTLRDKVVVGTKKCKERITGGLCSNIDGSVKLPPLVINKVLQPRAFSQHKIKRPNNLSIHWYANRKVWMTGPVFQDWIMKFDNFMKALGRKKVAMISIMLLATFYNPF